MAEFSQSFGTMKSTLPHVAPLTTTPTPPPASQSCVVPGIESTIVYVGPPTFETSATLTFPVVGSSQLIVTCRPLGQVTSHYGSECQDKIQ